MAKSMRVPKHIHVQNHISKFLTVEGTDMWCEICGAEVTAMSIVGFNRFINAHHHGLNVQLKVVDDEKD